MKQAIKQHAPWAVALWRRFTHRHLLGGKPQDVFSRIYQKNHWGATESISGAGSSSRQTAAIRAALPTVLPALGKTLLDVPCGDFNWQKDAIPPGMRYIGGDIVPELIQRNRVVQPAMDFRVIDLITDDLPMSDVLLTRDCLVHLSFPDALKAIENIRRSGIRYLIATTFVGRRFNEDIPTGAWRPLNMRLAPFDFPEPLQLIDENCGGEFSDKALGVWRVADL